MARAAKKKERKKAKARGQAAMSDVDAATKIQSLQRGNQVGRTNVYKCVQTKCIVYLEQVYSIYRACMGGWVGSGRVFFWGGQ